MKPLALALALSTFAVSSTATQAVAQVSPSRVEIKSFHLNYATTPAEQNEIVTGIRNICEGGMRIFLVPTRNEVLASGTPDQLMAVEAVVKKLDVPTKLYRLTYTFIESDGGKRIGLQRYSMALAPGQRMQMKQGSRVPLVTGGVVDGKTRQDRTYLDVGLNFDSEIERYGEDGIRLRAKVEQSSLAAEPSGLGPEDPLIRQTMLEGNSLLVEGKSQILGAVDVAGSTRRLEVEVLVEALR